MTLASEVMCEFGQEINSPSFGICTASLAQFSSCVLAAPPFHIHLQVNLLVLSLGLAGCPESLVDQIISSWDPITLNSSS